MHLIIIIIFLLSTQTLSCPETRDALLRCFKRLMDKNNNNVITIEEIDEFIKTSSCLNTIKIQPYITGKMIINTCDINGDGVLSLEDWSHHTSCIASENIIERVCEFCQLCK
jgi:Ca2+-binding EF-hand superfamily protein